MQYRVYRNQSGSQSHPWLLDVQSDIIGQLNIRMVIPLFPRDRFKGTQPVRLCPVVKIEGKEYLVMTHQMASVLSSMLGEEISSLAAQRDEIKAAIDFLLDGF